MRGETPTERPDPPDGSPLGSYWDKPTWELVSLKPAKLTAGQKERHRIYMLLLMAIIADYWNPLKKGRTGFYPFNPKFRAAEHPYEYKGHNIAAIAVDGEGRVIAFDFNHNKLFNSSAEHAEARLIRRVFALAQISDVYDTVQTDFKRRGEYDMLSDVTIYTSLESCAQCAGMMALGNVKEVVYLQADPGMYRVGNILFKLSPDLPRAPRPITAREIGLESYGEKLEDLFINFQDEVSPEKPFHQAVHDVSTPGKDDIAPSISSFLCGADPHAVFKAAAKEFSGLTLDAPDERPLDRSGAPLVGEDGKPRGLTNVEALEKARKFLSYAKTNGRRGTPHRV